MRLATVPVQLQLELLWTSMWTCCFVQLVALCLSVLEQCSAAGPVGRANTDALQRLQSKTDDESSTEPSMFNIETRPGTPNVVVAAIEPARSLLVALLESYGGKAYGRLADTILAVGALLVAHLLVWCCVYARQRFDLTDDGQLSVALASRGGNIKPKASLASMTAAPRGEGADQASVRISSSSELRRRTATSMASR